MEWRRLTEHYRSLPDGELRDLAADMTDLTETAQQALKEEMKRRGVAAVAAQPAPATQRDPIAQSAPVPDDWRDWGGDFYHAPPGRGEREEPEIEGPVDYTWKVPLCECALEEQAQQLTEALRRAGLDSWVKRAGGSYSKIFVAADQLEQARSIAAQPIPAEIVQAVKQDADAGPDEFNMPVCPKCGATDPYLMAVEPANRWRCGACGQLWVETDAEPRAAGGD